MSVYVNEEKGKIIFSNRIAYICDVFEFKRPVTYIAKNTPIDDGITMVQVYVKDEPISNILPDVICGKTYNDVVINAYKQIIDNYFYGTNSINDPVVKYIL